MENMPEGLLALPDFRHLRIVNPLKMTAFGICPFR